MSRRGVVASLSLLAVLAGCGLDPDDEPVPIPSEMRETPSSLPPDE